MQLLEIPAGSRTAWRWVRSMTAGLRNSASAAKVHDDSGVHERIGIDQSGEADPDPAGRDQIGHEHGTSMSFGPRWPRIIFRPSSTRRKRQPRLGWSDMSSTSPEFAGHRTRRLDPTTGIRAVADALRQRLGTRTPWLGMTALDVVWVGFASINLAGMVIFWRWGPIPFNLIWVSFTLLYGVRGWGPERTGWMLGAVVVATGTGLGIEVFHGAQPPAELAEVPLLSGMFLAVVWQGQQRLLAVRTAEGASEANLRLLERERAFVQDASHQLRTPITIALGHAELLQRDALGAQGVRDARVVVGELLRLRTLADRLLLLAASEDPAFLHRLPIDVSTLVEQAVERWSTTPRRWLLGTVERQTAYVDEERIVLALDALLENAVKHTRPGDAIELSVGGVGSCAMIRVSDRGCGIRPEEVEHLFDRFRKGAAVSEPTGGGGTGLGLAIVQAIVGAHDGSVHVSGRPGWGATFEILLPRASGSRPQPCQASSIA